MSDVFKRCLGQDVVNFKVKNMHPLKRIEYIIRGWVKRNEFLTNFYFKYFKKKEVGHGTQL